MQMPAELKARGKTVLVISHDDTNYRAADRIIKLDKGQVVSNSFARSGVREGVSAPSAS